MDSPWSNRGTGFTLYDTTWMTEGLHASDEDHWFKILTYLWATEGS